MNFLKNIISPKASLGILSKAIEMELKFKVPVYDMVYDANKKEIFFHIPVEGKIRRYPYVNKTFNLPDAIEAMTKKEIKNGSTIDVVKLRLENGNYFISMYYRDENGEKKLTKKTL